MNRYNMRFFQESSLLSNADKARLAEDHMLRDSREHNLTNSPFSSFVRGKSKLQTPRVDPRDRSPSRSPPPGRKLAPLVTASPRKASVIAARKADKIKFGPGTKAYDGNVGKTVSTSYGGPTLKKCPSDPTQFPGGGGNPAITVRGLEGDEHHFTQGWATSSLPARHTRQGSDPLIPAISPRTIPLGGEQDGSIYPEDFFRGQTASHISIISMSEDFESHPRLSPLKPSLSPRVGGHSFDASTPRGAGALTNSYEDIRISPIKEHGNSPRTGPKGQILNLDRMQITTRQFSPAVMDAGVYNYPTSKKLLPPTPVFPDTPDTDRREKVQTSKDNSPRSDEEDEYDDESHVTRAKSVLRHGDFILEETQVHTSNDSGLPEDKTSSDSSKSSSVASSTSYSNGSPRTAQSMPHSNSTSALSSLVVSSLDKPGGGPADGKNTGINKNKRNLSFSNVRENTGFVKPPTTSGETHKGGGGASSSIKRGNTNSVRRSMDSGRESPSVGGNRQPRTSLSGHREGEKSLLQSAKLRIIAKDNAAKPEGSGGLDNISEHDSGVSVSANRNKPTNVNKLGATERQQSSSNKTSGIQSVSQTGRNKTLNHNGGAQPQVLQLKGGTSAAAAKTASHSSSSSTAAGSKGELSSSAGAKVIHVQEASVSSEKPQSKSNSNTAGGTAAKQTRSNSVQSSNNKPTRSNNVENSSGNKAGSSDKTGSSDTTGSSSNKTGSSDKVHQPVASRKEPVSANVNTTGRPGRQSVNSSSTRTNTSSVTDRQTENTLNNNATGSVKQGTSSSGLVHKTTSAVLSSKQSPTHSNSQTGASSNVGVSSAISRTGPVPVARQSSSQVPGTKPQVSNVQQSKQVPSAKTPVTKSSSVPATTSNPSSGTRPNRSISLNTNSKTSTTNKPNYTTTMRISLQTMEPENNNNTVSKNSDGTIFNKGEAPVAPPRKKKGSASSRSSSDSGEMPVINLNDSENTTEYSVNKDSGIVSRNTTVTEYSVHTLKPGMTPLGSGMYSNMSKVPTGSKDPPVRPPLPASKQVSASVASPQSSVDHSGPQIIDPFESLNERRRKEFTEMMAREAERKQQAPKSGGKGGRGGNSTVKKDAKSTRPERQTSAGKGRRTRTKQQAGGEESKKRPRSSTTTTKRKKKGGKKKEEDTRLSENADSANVALIGGIGWHIETGCNEQTDVQAVTVLSDTDSESDEEINITVGPDNCVQGDVTDRYGRPLDMGRLKRELTIRVSGTLPGQTSQDTDSDSQYSSDSDFCDIPEYAEAVHDEVTFSAFTEQAEKSGRDVSIDRSSTTRLSLREKNRQQRMKQDSQDTEKMVHRSTQEALSHFDEKVSRTDLDDMLVGDIGTKPTKQRLPNIYSNTSPRLTNVTKVDNKTAKEKTPLRRNNSMPSSKPRLGPQPAPRRRHNSTKDTGDNVDPETEQMIEEILKATPNPSLTLSIGRDKPKATTSKSMTREEFEDALNKGGGISFREVIGSGDRNKNRRLSSEDHNANLAEDDHIARLVRNRSQAELQELIEWKNKVEDLNELEQKQLHKLMNTVKNLGLKVDTSVGSVAEKGGGGNAGLLLELPVYEENEVVYTKPPAGPSVPVSAVGKGAGGAAPSERHKMEKSPRFVRRKDASYREEDGDKPDNHLSFGADSVSSFGSISIPSDSLRDDLNLTLTGGSGLPGEGGPLVDDRTEVVTSRLGGRRSAASSRAASSVFSQEDVIQWKRGNILGKGAYGIVWCGLVNSGELIAVKQIELNIEDRSRAEEEYEKIQEEVDLLKTLKHPNIVGYMGTSLEDSTVSIFMQFVPGGSIANLLARFGALEEEVFCNYTKQILEGVQYLHSNSVIHRDIKGGNIMLMHNGIIKLIDFGCAKRLCLNVSTKVTAQSKSRLLKSMRGTPYWMAPEVVKETGHGTQSDIWSIGCTVHEMATKSPPWAAMPQMTAIFSIGNDAVPVPELPEKCSPESRAFSRVCMTRDPNKRPSATELLEHPFILRRRKSRSNSVANVNDFR